MTIDDEDLAALRNGYLIRRAVPELGRDVILLPATAGDHCERVLEEALADLREKRAWAALAREAARQWAEENPY